MHGEQSLGREEFIGPALMVFSTKSHTRSLLLLSQDRPQPSAYKAIHPFKGVRMSMLEIVKPATQCRIQFGNNFRQPIPARALGPHPDAIVHGLKTLPSHPASPHFEVIAQKVKTLPPLPTVSHVGLLGIETQAIDLYPGFHLGQRRLGCFSTTAQHHKVIRVSHHPIALLLHLTVQGMKVDVGQKRTNHRTLRCAPNGRPAFHLLDDVLTEKRLYQGKYPAIAHLLLYVLHKPRVRNCVEVAPQIGIHHKGVAFSEQPLHFSKRVFAAPTRAKTITHLQEHPLKNGLQHQLERRLYDAVFDYRYPQGSKLSSPLGNLHPPHRHRSVASLLKRYAELLKIHLRSRRKPLDALTVDSCCSGICLYFLPGCLKRLSSIHFVNQAEPFTSSDAVFQRRQHALVPHRSFYPRPIPAVSLCALCSLLRHYRRLAFALPLCVAHASTFLSLPSLGAALLSAPLAALPQRYYGDSDSCAAHHPQRRSPCLPHHTFLSFHLQPRWAA